MKLRNIVEIYQSTDRQKILVALYNIKHLLRIFHLRISKIKNLKTNEINHLADINHYIQQSLLGIIDYYINIGNNENIIHDIQYYLDSIHEEMRNINNEQVKDIWKNYRFKIQNILNQLK